MAESSVSKKARVKSIKKACRSCAKTRNLTITDCCNNWICDDSINYLKGICNWEHKRYSCCNFHHNERHEGVMENCEECKKMGLSEYEFEEVICVSCGFKSRGMLDFAFQLDEDFYCTKDECQAKGRPAASKSVKKASRIVMKKVKRACRSCGKTKKLTKTECCNNWICNDEHKYRLFSFALNSCYRNHHRYSSCTHHHEEKHEGRWQDCERCKENPSAVCSDFDEVTCVSCGFKSETMENFAFQLNKDFYCKEKECQKKGKELLPKGGAKKVTVKKIKRACCLCRKTIKLTKTECCDNWICNDSHKYRLFSFARNSCWRNHYRYSCCAFHHNDKHEGKWQDCQECMEMGTGEYDLEEVTCASCGFKSQTKGYFAFQVKKDFYCKKVECQKVGKTPPPPKVRKTALSQKVGKTPPSQNGGKTPTSQKVGKIPTSKGAKRKAEENRAEVKKAKKACRLCGKARKLTKTECCDSWVCNTSSALNSCYRNHDKYSCCAFHHSQGHEGRTQECERCKKLSTFNFDFDDFETNISVVEKENVDAQNIPKNAFTCICCGFTSETVDAFAFQLNNDFYCTKDECQKKGKPPPLSEN